MKRYVLYRGMGDEEVYLKLENMCIEIKIFDFYYRNMKSIREMMIFLLQCMFKFWN